MAQSGILSQRLIRNVFKPSLPGAIATLATTGLISAYNSTKRLGNQYSSAIMVSNRKRIYNKLKKGAKKYITARVPRNFARKKYGDGEIKCVDLPYATYGLDSTGAVKCINLIQTGSSYNNRIGRRTCLVALYLHGYLFPQAENTGVSYGRIAIVYDKQPNGALPAWSDVFQDDDQTGSTTNTAWSNINLNNRSRFWVVRDIRRNFPAIASYDVVGTPEPSSMEVQVDMTQFFQSQITQYKADSDPAVITDIATGSLLIMTYGNQVNASGWNLGCTIRLRFCDS